MEEGEGGSKAPTSTLGLPSLPCLLLPTQRMILVCYCALQKVCKKLHLSCNPLTVSVATRVLMFMLEAIRLNNMTLVSGCSCLP